MNHSQESRAFWIREPGAGEIRSRPLPEPGEGEVRIRTLYSGISRGTESLVFRGEVPPSQYGVMRAPFQEGDFPGPVKYGYASVGRVEEVGPGVQDLSPGQLVFALHPHEEAYLLPAAAAFPLPEGLPPGRAVLSANMETAVNALWDARPGVGDRILVVGGGVVGLLSGWLCARIPGTRVKVVDPNPARAAVAEALGMAWSRDPPRATDHDLTIHASGTAAGLRAALSAAGTEATVLELSWYGTREVELPLGEAFHSRRLRIRSSQVGSLPPERTPRWTRGSRLELALRLLRDPVLDAVVTGESEFGELPQVLAELAGGERDALCHRIHYSPP